jgi:hypothetical protein
VRGGASLSYQVVRLTPMMTFVRYLPLALIDAFVCIVLIVGLRRCTNYAPWWAKRILQRLDDLVATLADAVQGWTDYAAELKAQRDEAVAALAEANTRAQSAVEALNQFVADDAATDASQLATQAQQDADFVANALAVVKNPPAEPDPIPVEPEPPVV